MFSGHCGSFYHNDENIVYFNQSSEYWTHPYPYNGDDSDLRSSGCGIFSMCVIIRRLSGITVAPEKLADYALIHGGRDDTGTDRPSLLQGLVDGGRDVEYGFIYNGDGLVNDHERLWSVLSCGGCAMCNLRTGHIVACLDSREYKGERQMLVVDSACETYDARIKDKVKEVIPETLTRKKAVNANGLTVGAHEGYAAYWVPVDSARDFNLIWKR